MLLRIQKDESLRSYVERNLFVNSTSPAMEVFKKLPYCLWGSRQVISIANVLGWYGCYGFNKLVHTHTEYPWHSVLKSKFDYSYSGSNYISGGGSFDDMARDRPYCPVCAKEDKHLLGYSYWRRIHYKVKVCSKHNVVLLSTCQFCEKPFARGGHAVNVMWSGCAGRHLGDAQPVLSDDPWALRIAQFFDGLCLLDHHIHAETVAAVVEQKLKKAADGASDPLLNNKLAQFQVYNEYRGKHGDYKARNFSRLFSDIIEIAALLFETFSELVKDCLARDPHPVNIDAYWDTYSISPLHSEHFIKENYQLGVVEWSWPHLNHFKSDPLYSEYLRTNVKRKFLCCNAPDSHLVGVQATNYRRPDSHPAVPRLTHNEILAMTEHPSSF